MGADRWLLSRGLGLCKTVVWTSIALPPAFGRHANHITVCQVTLLHQVKGWNPDRTSDYFVIASFICRGQRLFHAVCSFFLSIALPLAFVSLVYFVSKSELLQSVYLWIGNIFSVVFPFYFPQGNRFIKLFYKRAGVHQLVYSSFARKTGATLAKL